jgi:glycosyltransferase involved in cell wall biosynthesis
MSKSQLVVAKIIKTDVVSIESVFLKPFLEMDSTIRRIVIFLAPPSKEKIDELNNVKFFYSPIKSRKAVKEQAKWVADILKTEQVDIVHCEQHSATVIGVKAKKIAKTPYLVSHVHGNNMARGFSRQLFYRFNKKQITKVIACSEFVRQNILDTYPGYREDKVVTLANGIDLAKFDSNLISQEQITELRESLGLINGEKMFLATCRLSPDKNLDLLFNAFAKVCQENDKIKLFVAGKGRLEDELNQLIHSLKMEGKITLLGFRTDIKELLSSCDCFVLPSRREGFGLSPVEAAALAKPVIFSDTGIGRELLFDICPQFLLRPNQLEDIESALRKFLSMPIDELKQVGEAFAEKVKENFSYKILMINTAQLYREVVSKK